MLLPFVVGADAGGAMHYLLSVVARDVLRISYVGDEERRKEHAGGGKGALGAVGVCVCM